MNENPLANKTFTVADLMAAGACARGIRTLAEHRGYIQPGFTHSETRIWAKHPGSQALSFSFADILAANADRKSATDDLGWALVTLAPQLLSEEETQYLGEIMKALRDVTYDLIPEKGPQCWTSPRFPDEWMMEQRPSLLRNGWETPIPNFFTYLLAVSPAGNTVDKDPDNNVLARMLLTAESPEHLRDMAAAYATQLNLNKLALGHTPIKLSDLMETAHPESAVKLLAYKRWLPEGFEGLDDSLETWLSLKSEVLSSLPQDTTITIDDLLNTARNVVRKTNPDSDADRVLLDFSYDLMSYAEVVTHYNSEAPYMTRMLANCICESCFNEGDRKGVAGSMFLMPTDAYEHENLQQDWLFDLCRAYNCVPMNKAALAMRCVEAWAESSNAVSLQTLLDKITAEAAHNS